MYHVAKIALETKPKSCGGEAALSEVR
jgi:hypothetical protein